MKGSQKKKRGGKTKPTLKWWGKWADSTQSLFRRSVGLKFDEDAPGKIKAHDLRALFDAVEIRQGAGFDPAVTDSLEALLLANGLTNLASGEMATISADNTSPVYVAIDRVFGWFVSHVLPDMERTLYMHRRPEMTVAAYMKIKYQDFLLVSKFEEAVRTASMYGKAAPWELKDMGLAQEDVRNLRVHLQLLLIVMFIYQATVKQDDVNFGGGIVLQVNLRRALMSMFMAGKVSQEIQNFLPGIPGYEFDFPWSKKQAADQTHGNPEMTDNDKPVMIPPQFIARAYAQEMDDPVEGPSSASVVGTERHHHLYRAFGIWCHPRGLAKISASQWQGAGVAVPFPTYWMPSHVINRWGTWLPGTAPPVGDWVQGKTIAETEKAIQKKKYKSLLTAMNAYDESLAAKEGLTQDAVRPEGYTLYLAKFILYWARESGVLKEMRPVLVDEHLPILARAINLFAPNGAMSMWYSSKDLRPRLTKKQQPLLASAIWSGPPEDASYMYAHLCYIDTPLVEKQQETPTEKSIWAGIRRTLAGEGIAFRLVIAPTDSDIAVPEGFALARLSTMSINRQPKVSAWLLSAADYEIPPSLYSGAPREVQIRLVTTADLPDAPLPLSASSAPLPPSDLGRDASMLVRAVADDFIRAAPSNEAARAALDDILRWLANPANLK